VLIAELVRIKSQLHGVDGGLWPYHLPELKATDEQIARVEDDLGVELPSSYREFLRHANGWRGFFQTVDLLGCDDLTGGRYQEYYRSLVDALRPPERAAAGLSAERQICIGATLVDRDLFVLSYPADGSPKVIWTAGEEVDRWCDFEDFFRSMIEYNRRELQHFLSAASKS
jgi:hypothetical protein